MTLHLFGNILTGYGTAANNRGENEGNITTLQKIFWKNEVHTTVSAEAIRWALRYYWQVCGNPDYTVNRQWNDSENDNAWQDPSFDDELYIDDDVLGYMRAEGAKEEGSDTSKTKDKKAPKGKGTTTAKRGVLEVTRAVSTLPYEGDITFNAASGKKGSTSLYGTEVHATRYQYGFALTPERLKDKSRTLAVVEGLTTLGQVAGNHSRFLYDFSPDSILLRWTHDFSPRFLYSFEENRDGNLSMPELVRRVRSKDIDPKELWVAGAIANTPDGEILDELGANVLSGVKLAAANLMQEIAKDLELQSLELAR